jgi:hypothetical protein
VERPGADPAKKSRVRPGQIFNNGLVKFMPGLSSDGSQYVPLTQLAINSINRAVKLGFDGNDLATGYLLRGVMPVDLRFSPENDTLYMVDITGRGLVPITFDPMPAQLSVYNAVQ